MRHRIQRSFRRLFAIGVAAFLFTAPCLVKGLVPEGDLFTRLPLFSSMDLTPGGHQLIARAIHPSGLYTAYHTNVFTNNVSQHSVAVTYDNAGNVTQRVWKNPGGTTQRTQTLGWDGRGRLYKVSERDNGNNGFDWWATYDALGRRLRTATVMVTNNVAYTAQPRFIKQFYDPAVEFLEVGVEVDGRLTWKVIGADERGVYGTHNGLGTLEATAPDGEGFRPVVADARGNLLAWYDWYNPVPTWTTARPTAFGAATGYRPPPLGFGADLVEASAWRGRWSDPSGMYGIGLRPYEPESGRWLSADPLGHDGSAELYAAFNGDGVNYFDSDGRFGKQWTDYSQSIDVNGVGSFLEASFYGGAGSILQGIGSGGSVYDQARNGMALANQEISTYSGGQAFLANTLRLPADFAFGTTALFNDPLGTAPQIPGAIAQLPGNISQNVQNFSNDPSLYGAFNLVENGLQVWGLVEGGAALYRTGTGLIPPGAVSTPHGPAVQAATAEAQAALGQVQNGATVYRAGEFGVQNTGNAQFWSIQNPVTTPGFAGQLGMPGTAAPTFDWMMGGRVAPGSPVITRPAPGIGVNAGGSMEAVVPPGGVRIDWFHMPD
ncbi:hypothetical protein GC207_13520 [bacterium]|nr:hypothetical protein [bacterium]